MIDIEPDFAESFLPVPGLFVDPIDVPVGLGPVDVLVDVLLGVSLETVDIPLAIVSVGVLLAGADDESAALGVEVSTAAADVEGAAPGKEVATAAAAVLYYIRNSA
jgi:hypothetical protein